MSFAEFFQQLPEIDGLRGSERIVLLCLKWHCGENGKCYPGKKKLSKEAGIDIQTLERSIRSLISKGWIERIEKPGKPNDYIVKGVSKSPSPKLRDPHFDTPTLPQNAPGSLPQNAPDIKEKKETERKIVRKPKSTMTKEEVTKIIQGLDLSKYQAKYPETDIEGCYEDFSEHFLCKNDLKTGKANWMLWTDWNKAFWNWLRKPWNRDRKKQDNRTVKPELSGPIWAEIKKLDPVEYSQLSYEAKPYACNAAGCRSDVDPPEDIWRQYMIKIYKTKRDPLPP